MAAGQCRDHGLGCSLTPHVLRGTPRLSVRAIVVAGGVRGRGLSTVLVLVLVLVLATPPLAHPASLRPRPN